MINFQVGWRRFRNGPLIARMPTPGLCRVASFICQDSGGPLILFPRLVGIIRGSQETPTGDQELYTDQEWRQKTLSMQELFL